MEDYFNETTGAIIELTNVNILIANRETIRFMALLRMFDQSNSDKYKVIKPLFKRLNLYCNEQNFRFRKNSNYLSIPLNAILDVAYLEKDDILYFLLKQDKSLHAINMSNFTYTIFITKRPHPSVISFFLGIYHKIRIYFITRQMINEVKKQMNKKDR